MSFSDLPLAVFALIQDTPAADGEVPPEPSFLVPMLLVGAIFWFIVIGPERKKRKQRDTLMAGLKKGDKVMTTTGMYASVAQVNGDVVTLQIADGVRVKFAVAAIQGLVDPEVKKEEAEKKNDSDKSDKKEKQELLEETSSSAS